MSAFEEIMEVPMGFGSAEEQVSYYLQLSVGDAIRIEDYDVVRCRTCDAERASVPLSESTDVPKAEPIHFGGAEMIQRIR